MEYQKPRQYRKNEQVVQEKIKRKLRKEGWLVEKIHGNKFQSGLPDLYCFHKEHGHRWVEIKTPTGKLTSSQFSKFQKWEQKDLGIWILICDSEYDLLFQKPNWRRFQHRVQKQKKNLVHVDKNRYRDRKKEKPSAPKFEDFFPKKET